MTALKHAHGLAEQALLSEAFQWVSHASGLPFTEERLLQLVREKGIDFATAVIYQQLATSKQHEPFIKEIDKLVAQKACCAMPEVSVVVVPGAFYKEYPDTGVDGQVVRDLAVELKFPVVMIPTLSMGTLEENAAIIRGWLRTNPQHDIILVSISKGGADVKKALSSPQAASDFQNVRAWINTGGLLDGTPLVGHLLARRWSSLVYKIYFAIRQYKMDFMYEVSRGPGTPLDFKLEIPDHITLVHLAGFPLKCHLHNRLARKCHRLLTPLGPNDGNLMLWDLVSLPGLLYPIWGADHYLQPQHGIHDLVRAVFQYLAQLLGLGSKPATASISQDTFGIPADDKKHTEQ